MRRRLPTLAGLRSSSDSVALNIRVGNLIDVAPYFDDSMMNVIVDRVVVVPAYGRFIRVLIGAEDFGFSPPYFGRTVFGPSPFIFLFGQDREEMTNTFVHELVHVMLFDSAANSVIVHGSRYTEDNYSEEFIADFVACRHKALGVAVRAFEKLVFPEETSTNED